MTLNKYYSRVTSKKYNAKKLIVTFIRLKNSVYVKTAYSIYQSRN